MVFLFCREPNGIAGKRGKKKNLMGLGFMARRGK